MELPCHRLPLFDETDLRAVRAVFAASPVVTFHQAWQASPDPDFQPGEVRVGWRDMELFVFAELMDRDIFTRATRLNEHMWELGDVFEIFLRPVEQEAYVEFHVTPNNQRLQLRFPNTVVMRAAQKTLEFEPFLLPGTAIRTNAWVEADAHRWAALAVIPAAVVCDNVQPLPGRQWRYSFSRYDYTRGRTEPVISSTSLHARPDFHSQTEWNTLVFTS